MQTNLTEWLSSQVFKKVHRSSLVYNTCWEDPRVDRQALNIRKTDTIAMITSAGCNALDYALLSPRKIFAIDVNAKQNALLELKIAGIKSLSFEMFFQIFGNGRLRNFKKIYGQFLRKHLSIEAQKYWDQHTDFFEESLFRPTFYFRGSSGLFASVLSNYIQVLGLQEQIEGLFECESLEEQSTLYTSIRSKFFNRWISEVMSWDLTLSLLGIPRSQRYQIESQYPGGVPQFVKDSVDSVFLNTPLKDNYFWWVYIHGAYKSHLCPEYLKYENFESLKNGGIQKIEIRTSSLSEFFKNCQTPISKFVLLDHMDWLSTHSFHSLEEQWQHIFNCSDKNARIIWRSAGLNTHFLNKIQIKVHGKALPLMSQLTLQNELSQKLHLQDRVRTYGSFYIADLKKKIAREVA